jgi:hypothetical protein
MPPRPQSESVIKFSSDFRDAVVKMKIAIDTNMGVQLTNDETKAVVWALRSLRRR